MIKQVEKRVCNALKKADIPFILYGSTVITDRETNDVDIIVKPEDFRDRVDKVFKDLGYHDPIPFIFEKKYQDGTRYNVEVKYDLHPKITKRLSELWSRTYIDNRGYRLFNPDFHALLLYLHTDRHIKEGLFDNRRITDLNKIKVSYEKVRRLGREFNVEDRVNNIINLLEDKPTGYSREELFYPSKKKLFEDELTIKLLGRALPSEQPDDWYGKVKTIEKYRRNRIKEYRDWIRKPDHRISWEVGYGGVT